MHQNLNELLKKHPCRSKEECTDALREIIQEIALLGLWREKFFEHAAFYGGTALRVLHGIDRFSEDLDFSLLTPNPNFSLDPYNRAIKDELESFGFSVSVDRKLKSSLTQIESAFIKTSTTVELIRIGAPSLSVRGLHPETLLKIKLEVDTNPPSGFSTEVLILPEPAPVSIKVYSLKDLFAGKVHALLCRNWKGRVKGRDWYDFVWLIRKGAEVHLSYLQNRMHESTNLAKDEILTEALLRELIANKIDNLDVERAIEDIRPFVFDSSTISSWSREFFHAMANKLIIN